MEGYKDEYLSDEVQKWRHLVYTVICDVVKINFEGDYMIIKNVGALSRQDQMLDILKLLEKVVIRNEKYS